MVCFIDCCNQWGTDLDGGETVAEEVEDRYKMLQILKIFVTQEYLYACRQIIKYRDDFAIPFMMAAGSPIISGTPCCVRTRRSMRIGIMI